MYEVLAEVSPYSFQPEFDEYRKHAFLAVQSTIGLNVEDLIASAFPLF